MDYSIKRTRDFYEGQIKRELEVNYLNNKFFEKAIGCSFYRFHHVLKAMNTNEKAENNILNNYIGAELGGTGMALHYRLRKIGVEKEIPFIFAYEDSGGVFLKLPSEFKPIPQAYLDLLVISDYHLLIVGKKSTETKRLYSRPISFKDIVNQPRVWKWQMGESKGNTNRLQFYGTLSAIKYSDPTEGNLIDPPLLIQLENLLL